MKYKLYTTDGSELVATSVQLAKNNAGTGYRVVDEQGHILFYKTEELTTIMQLNGDSCGNSHGKYWGWA